MKPEGHPWIGDRKVAGVEHKQVGFFGGSGIRFTRMQPGAKIPRSARTMPRSAI